MLEYYSLRHISVSATIGNKISRGVFIYCYKKHAGIDISNFTNYIDNNILRCIQNFFPDAKIQHQEILDDSYWQKWLATLQSSPINFYLLPTCYFNNLSYNETDVQNHAKYPNFTISYYPKLSIFKEDPSYPFNCIKFRYPIELIDDYTTFAKDMSEFRKNYFFTFEQACPIIKFNNQYHNNTFALFHKFFYKKLSFRWPELMHVTVNVYNQEHLKPFITNNPLFKDGDLSDSPYIVFPCLSRNNNAIQCDIIEYTPLCDKLQLTLEEKFALIAHEIGHIVEELRQNKLEGNELEKACDTYATDLGLTKHLESALQKMLSSNLYPSLTTQQLSARLTHLKNW